jgi:hypothetical protein
MSLGGRRRFFFNNIRGAMTEMQFDEVELDNDESIMGWKSLEEKLPKENRDCVGLATGAVKETFFSLASSPTKRIWITALDTHFDFQSHIDRRDWGYWEAQPASPSQLAFIHSLNHRPVKAMNFFSLSIFNTEWFIMISDFFNVSRLSEDRRAKNCRKSRTAGSSPHPGNWLMENLHCK